MICPVLADISYTECIQWLENSDIVELRLDKLFLSFEEIKTLFSFPIHKIATCRPGATTEKKREELLKHAITCGATYVDLEVESFPQFGTSVSQYAGQNDCKIIISYHNFEKTPPMKELLQIIDRCLNLGADLVKVACQVTQREDMARLLGLYENSRFRDHLISIGMGPKGKLSRIVAPFLGSPFSYASISSQKKTADGQLSVSEMKKIIYQLENAE